MPVLYSTLSHGIPAKATPCENYSVEVGPKVDTASIVCMVVLRVVFLWWYCEHCLHGSTASIVCIVVLRVLFVWWYCESCLYGGTASIVYIVVLQALFAW